MKQDIRILKQKYNGAMIYLVAKFSEVGSTHPWESFVSSDPPLKIARENALNRR